MNESLLMKETVALEKASTGDFGQCCSIDLHGKMHVIFAKKSAGLKQDPNRIHHVCVGGGCLHKQDIMPLCVLTLLRSRYLNPSTFQYMGHQWG